MSRLEKIQAARALRQAQLVKALDTPAEQPKTPEELFNITLEAVKEPYGALFTPAELMKKGMTSEEANAIHTFLSTWGFIDDSTNMLRSSATPNELENFKRVFEDAMNTAHSTTANEKSAATSVFPDNNTATDVLANLDASTGSTPDSSSTTEGVSFEIGAAPQTDFAATPLGKAYAEHSAEFQGEYSFSFLRIQKLITWIIENEHPLDKRELINKINSGSFTKENPENIIERLKQRGIISEDAESGVFLLPASLSPDQLRAKIYFAILDVDDPSVASTVGIFRSFPSVTSAATPAAAPASLDLDISAASAAAPLVEPISPEAKSSEKIINNLVDGLKTNSWSRLEIYDLLGSNLSFDVAFDFVWEVCNKNLATESDDSTQDEKRYRFNYIPDSPDQEAAFKRELTGLLGQCQDKNTPDGSVPKAAPDTETADAVLNAAPDKKRQRIESVARLFSALKGLAQKSPNTVRVIACFTILGVGTAMYSGKEMAPKAKPAAEAAGGRAPGAAAPQEQSGEAAKTTVRAYRNAELYRGLDSKKRETVDRLMTSTAEQFMMPYLNTVTIYQNGIPKPINLNEASKKTLFKEMNTDWKTLVAKSFSEGPHDPQGADEITLTDTNSKTYSQVYVRVDEQVAKAFKEIRDVTVVVLKKDSKEPYPEGRLEDIYNDIKKSVTAALNK